MNGKYVGRDVVLQRSMTGKGNIGLQFRKVGRVVQLLINCTTSGESVTAYEDVIITVPKMFRPMEGCQVFFPNMVSTNGTVLLFGDSSGELKTSVTIPAGTGIWAFVTYIGRPEMSLQEGET